MKFKLAVFGRHLCQSTAACLTAMTQGDLTTLTLIHWQVALITGSLTGLVGIMFTFGKLIKLQKNRYGVALVALFGTVIADYANHPTHFGNAWTEAVVTGLGAATLCLLMSFTPVGKAIEKMSK